MMYTSFLESRKRGSGDQKQKDTQGCEGPPGTNTFQIQTCETFDVLSSRPEEELAPYPDTLLNSASTSHLQS